MCEQSQSLFNMNSLLGPMFYDYMLWSLENFLLTKYPNIWSRHCTSLFLYFVCHPHNSHFGRFRVSTNSDIIGYNQNES